MARNSLPSALADGSDNKKKMKKITLTSILFLVLFAAALFCGCYSGKYGDEIDPCDPDTPVVLNGDTIEEWRIERNDEGCVIRIDLSEMNISNPNCLSGIELYFTLERLYLFSNNLTSIDLSPLISCINFEKLNLGDNQLTSIDLSLLAACTNLEVISLYANALTSINLSPLVLCTNLEWLSLWSNQITSINLTSLWDLDSLENLLLQYNTLDSASCAHVCDFIDEHPDCYVMTDCACP